MTPNIRRFQYQGEDTLELPAQRDAFVTLKAWLNDIADELAMPDKSRKQLLIVADEIFTNITSYGYPSGGGTASVSVDFDLSQAALTLSFSDNGIPFNPLEAPSPDVSKPIEEREIGGLGILLVKKMMDSVAYRRENDCNVLVLTKKIAQP